MLSAYNQNGQLINFIGLTKPEINMRKQGQKYFCPICEETLILKAGRKNIPHFSHLPNSDCPFQHDGEGEYHEQGKLDLFQWLRNQGVQAELEKYLPLIKQRPDILFSIGNKTIAIEYQCAKLSMDDYLKRNEGYIQTGITPIWILGSNRMKRKKTGMLYSGTQERAFIHRFSSTFPLTLYFYCPNTKILSVYQHIQVVGRNRLLGQWVHRPLSRTSFKSMFQEHAPNNQFLQQWKKEKHLFRTKPPTLYQSREEKTWRNWLYIKHTHNSLLPGIIYLPVSGQYRMKSVPWIWQSRLCLDFLHSLPPFKATSLSVLFEKMDNHFITDASFPLITAPPDPLKEYLQLLEYLGFVTFVSNTEFMRINPINFPENVEEGLREDDLIIKKLEKYPFSSGVVSHDS
ncbi:competence protein CoiA [Sediminibacillus massiliensis]|uniref:competence protein CoiA n=1 Tax=Sediminibacillus massiliensis TaxID=1926277 RepID=UPI00098839BE|nr:competence protein CoiA family protein [Sediminibacillus massiliensis]